MSNREITIKNIVFTVKARSIQIKILLRREKSTTNLPAAAFHFGNGRLKLEKFETSTTLMTHFP